MVTLSRPSRNANALMTALAAVADPTARLYDAFGAGTSLAGFVHPRSLSALGRAMAAGKRHGRFEGRELQMPAEFVIDHRGRIALAHYGRDVGDHVPAPALLAAVDSVRQLTVASSR